jgi:hypothetical protein
MGEARVTRRDSPIRSIGEYELSPSGRGYRGSPRAGVRGRSEGERPHSGGRMLWMRRGSSTRVTELNVPRHPVFMVGILWHASLQI